MGIDVRPVLKLKIIIYFNNLHNKIGLSCQYGEAKRLAVFLKAVMQVVLGTIRKLEF